MRELYLNNIMADIDDKTLIGFDIQSYDIKDPGRPKVVVSNNFTIPLTAKNRLITGFAGNSQVETINIYQKLEVKYNIDNDIIIENTRARVESIGERTNLFIYQKADVWDLLKTDKLVTIMPDLLDYICSKYSLPKSTNKFNGAISDFIDKITTGTGFYLPYFLGNFVDYQQSEPNYLETLGNIHLSTESNAKQGGHICLPILDFFQFLENKYDINFQTESIFDGNIFKDEYASKIYIPIQNIGVFNSGTEYWFDVSATGYDYAPLGILSPKAGLSVYDLITAFFKHFNILMDSIWQDGTFITRLYRFDDIATLAPVIDWSGGLASTPTFSPKVDGYAQKTHIKFKKVYENADPLINAKTISVKNENIESEKTITEIEGYVNAFAAGSVPLVNKSDGINTFSFFIDSGNTATVTVNINEKSVSKSLKIPALYSLDNEYNLLEAAMEYPKVYEIQKYLKLSDIRNMLFFAQYYIQELGGSFFINKISAFDANNKTSPTKIQLLKVSNKTPQNSVEANYWKDGFGNRFIDGFGNYFTY